jgi:hypothetical protein
VVVAGMAQFRPSGRLLVIDAEHIGPATEGDSIWEEPPSPRPGRSAPVARLLPKMIAPEWRPSLAPGLEMSPTRSSSQRWQRFDERAALPAGHQRAALPRAWRSARRVYRYQVWPSGREAAPARLHRLPRRGLGTRPAQRLGRGQAISAFQLARQPRHRRPQPPSGRRDLRT